jgi:APA family basic amino acid/polyamine antiporter
VPWIAEKPGTSALVTVLLLWLLTFVNWYGIKASGWVQSVTTVLKILPLLAVAALGLLATRPGNPSAALQIPLSVSGVTSAATLTLWAMLGLESATIPADKVANPARTIPLATLLGTIVTALICALACTTVLMLVPPATLATSNAPFVDLANRFWGLGAGKLVAVFAAISAFGALNGWILLQGELPRAMAIRGDFPRIFARESVHGTPGFGLSVGSCLATLLILANYQRSMASVFTFMILLSTTACLVLYALCSAALLRLQWTQKLGAAGPASTALGVVGILATAYSLWAIIGAGAEAVLWGTALLLAGVPLYFWYRRAR